MAESRTTRRRFLGLSAASAAAVLAPGGATAFAKSVAVGSRNADTVFRGGSVITVDGRRRIAEAMAVKDGTIVFVGDVGDVDDLIGRRTQVVDLAGRAVMPGIHDGHVHPLYAGRYLLQCSLGYLPLTVPEMQAMVQACLDDTVAEEPDGWLKVADWELQLMKPPGVSVTKAVLDVLHTARPIAVHSADGHNTLTNSRGLAIAGITASTPDPVDGVIVRDAQGQPTGLLIDGAQGLVDVVVPQPTFEEDAVALKTAIDVLNARGVTSINDAAVYGYILKLYSALQDRGELSLRANTSIVLERAGADDMAATLAYYDHLRRKFTRGRLRARTIKVFEDGVMEYPSQTAGLLEPYRVKENGHWVPGTSRGEIYFERQVIRQAVTAADADGWQVHIHAIGDRAVRFALDGFEAARMANGRNDHRHTIAHMELVDPGDYGRFADLDVLASFQLQWAERDPYTMESLKRYIGKQRWSRLYPSGSICDAGGYLTSGSDWPVDPATPFDAIQQAVTRTGPFPAPYDQPLNADQGIGLWDAIEMNTSHTAFQMHQERKTGSIEVGKIADVIVLDQDITAVPIDQVRATQVDQTFVAGESVYDRSTVTPTVRRAMEGSAASVPGRRRTAHGASGCC
jgi:predicted amidohydrolase YtcJ